MNDIVEKPETSIATTDSNTILQAIVQVAQNPEADVSKMESLWALKEKIDARDAEMQFNAAMVKAQTDMRPIAADASNPQTRSKYASYMALDKALRPIYTDNGFALSFDTADSQKELHVRVVCYLSHSIGHSRTYHVDMPADGKGAKGGDVMTKTHAAGAAMSYGMRYLLKMIFNVAVGEDDRDGNEPIARISEDQVNEIHSKISENEISMDGFLAWMKSTLKCETITDINVNSFDIVIKRINSAIRAKNDNPSM